MSHLQYFNYDSWGQKAKRGFYYSQAVRIGDRIECAGQSKLTKLSPVWTWTRSMLEEKTGSRKLMPKINDKTMEAVVRNSTK
ncbi:hypothetical protein N7457_001385 [Penicillium paradoxum]|uniref:uncharacterized protein n=1 Tax=Penicillium paradoxum TaxID=176176 RepID=UPI002546D2B5|nr:uncharacterized protein N7457_001385 [Penicillium paradoxum]KAJ5794786.1 hypothetical protein N7457_001385 [Penicillium paradoxum]